VKCLLKYRDIRKIYSWARKQI